MSNDEKALREQIARALWDHDNLHMSAAWRDMAWEDMGGSEPMDERIAYMLRAAALLPTVHAEAKRAQAQAWDEGNLAGTRDQANWDGWRYPRGYQEHVNPYRETEQGNA